MQWLWNRIYERSDNKELLVATLGALVQELGGSAVITLDQLNAVDVEHVEIARSDAPEGIRIFVRDVLR